MLQGWGWGFPELFACHCSTLLLGLNRILWKISEDVLELLVLCVHLPVFHLKGHLLQLC